MAGIPDRIVLKRDRDLEGRRHEIWVRRGSLALIAAVPVLALFNAFGQRPQTSTAAVQAASLKVSAAERVRSGLLYQARFRISARQELQKAILVLSSGWIEGMQVNTIEPSPVREASADGKLSLELGHVTAGRSFVLYVQFQVDPTNVGHREQTVWVYDGDRRLLTIHRTITIFP